MSKKLVLFFSVYESTKAVAQEIAAQTGADIVGSTEKLFHERVV